MVKWYARHADLTGATAVYALANLSTTNATVESVKVPAGYGHLKYLTASICVDAGLTADVGNIFVVKLGGDAMENGDQEIIIGALQFQETATSVVETVGTKIPFILPTNVWLKEGNPIDVSIAYQGTDIGSPVVSIGLGLERGRGGRPLQYRSRFDSVTQATDTYVSLETKADGGTGSFDIPKMSSFIPRALFCNIYNANAATAPNGNNFVFKLGGDAVGSSEQEILGGSLQFEEGGGTVTAGSFTLANPAVVPVEVPVTGGNSLDAQAAYKGTDGGTQFVGLTLELA